MSPHGDIIKVARHDILERLQSEMAQRRPDAEHRSSRCRAFLTGSLVIPRYFKHICTRDEPGWDNLGHVTN
jgi:hypothetical protein